MQLDVEGSDASQDDEPVLPTARPPIRKTAAGTVRASRSAVLEPKRARVDEPLIAPEVPPAHVWSSRRRGVNTRRHYAAAWELRDGADPDGQEEAYAALMVCHKKFTRYVNGAEDAHVLNLPLCDRCQTLGALHPLPVPHWLSDA